MPGSSFAVLGVFLNVTKQPTDRFLIVLVFLALDDHLHRRSTMATDIGRGNFYLFTSVDELIPAFFGEIFFSQEMLATVIFILDLFLVLLREPIRDVILDAVKG